MYMFYKNIDDLLDGRTIMYASKAIGVNREHTSLILRGQLACEYSVAKKFVDRFAPGCLVRDFFKETKARD